MSGLSDPVAYAERLQPHDSEQALNDNFDAFMGAVRLAAQVHRMTNVVFVVEASFQNEEGRTQQALQYAMIGDTAHMFPMLAEAYGACRLKYLQSISSLINRRPEPPAGLKK